MGAMMIRRAVLTLAILSALSHSANADPQGLSLWVEADGSSFLWNPTDLPITFDGYQLASETGSLDPVGWKSIADYVAGGQITDVLANLGAGALTFGEANPGTGNLAEVNLGGAGTIGPHAKFSLGKPFATLPPSADWYYKLSSGPGGPPGEIVYAPDTPEPSTFPLAALAGLGLIAFRRRGLRVSLCGPQ